MLPEFLEPAYMQRAVLAAVLVGLCAPSVGIYLVQRRLALMGDGIGHVALTGVAVGLLTGTSPVYTAVAVAVVGAVAIEVLRERGRTSGDVALAMLFYGGIAAGVVLVGKSDSATTTSLTGFLFGQLTTVQPGELAVIAVLAILVLLVTVGLQRRLFAVCHDEEYARVSGLPVRRLNLLLAVVAAVTVTVALRVVGVLLISALMVVPVAAAQQLTRGFRATFAGSVALGVACACGGVATSYYADTAPGATIVLLAIVAFGVGATLSAVRRSVRPAAASASGPAPIHADDLALPHGEGAA